MPEFVIALAKAIGSQPCGCVGLVSPRLLPFGDLLGNPLRLALKVTRPFIPVLVCSAHTSLRFPVSTPVMASPPVSGANIASTVSARAIALAYGNTCDVTVPRPRRVAHDSALVLPTTQRVAADASLCRRLVLATLQLNAVALLYAHAAVVTISHHAAKSSHVPPLTYRSVHSPFNRAQDFRRFLWRQISNFPVIPALRLTNPI